MCPFSVLVVSGVDSEGQPKFRAVDDFTRSEVNANTAPTEKLGCDTLDMLWELIRSMKESFDSEVHRAAQSEHARNILRPCMCVRRSCHFSKQMSTQPSGECQYEPQTDVMPVWFSFIRRVQ